MIHVVLIHIMTRLPLFDEQPNNNFETEFTSMALPSIDATEHNAAESVTFSEFSFARPRSRQVSIIEEGRDVHVTYLDR